MPDQEPTYEEVRSEILGLFPHRCKKFGACTLLAIEATLAAERVAIQDVATLEEEKERLRQLADDIHEYCPDGQLIKPGKEPQVHCQRRWIPTDIEHILSPREEN